MRRTGMLTALVLTAAVLCVLPGTWAQLMQFDGNRMDERLRPVRTRTVTVWLVECGLGDGKLIHEACAAFERQHEGVRVFLRTVTADELTAADAVLPHAVLFGTGQLCGAEAVCVPLTGVQGATGGDHAGQRLAAALWLSPNVLAVPRDMLNTGPVPTPAPTSLLVQASPAPPQHEQAVLLPEELPWTLLAHKGALEPPQGVAAQQVLACCPPHLRQTLVQGGAEDPPVHTMQPAAASLPVSRGGAPTAAPAITAPARVMSLAAYRTAVAAGEQLAPCALTPVISERVRWLALCRDDVDAQAFAQFLLTQMQPAAAAHALLPAQPQQSVQGDALCRALAQGYAGVLPNAFAHTPQQIAQLCADAWLRAEDPVRTLLGLR